MSLAESTVPKQLLAHVWQPGQSGNPLGRSVGSKNQYGEDFVRSLHKHWLKNGEQALDACLEESPSAYVRAAASIVPKDLNISTNDSLDQCEDDELRLIIATVRAVVSARKTIEHDGSETGPQAAGEPAQLLPALRQAT